MAVGGYAGGQPVRRAHVLAIVAAVYPPLQRRSVLEREHARGLQQPRQALASIENARSYKRPGRARGEAAAAAPAPVRDRLAGWQRCVRDDRPEEEPGAPAGQQDVAIFPEPAEARSLGRRPIDEGIVVRYDPRLPPGFGQHGRHLP